MTNDLAVSMAELEGESAELLPSRETLYCWKGGSGGGHNVSIVNQQVGSNQNGFLNLALVNGNVNILSPGAGSNFA
jgi:hypothetical protein